MFFSLCVHLRMQSSCPYPFWWQALSHGTKEGVDFCIELVSLPDCNYFLWEFIPEAGGKCQGCTLMAISA